MTNLQHNFRTLRSRIPQSTRIAPVVKGNAYGHGMVPIATRLEQCGADGLCVATVDEGIQLRRSGILIPIYVLGAILPEAAPDIVDFSLTPAVTSLSLATALSQAGAEQHMEVPVHVRVDVGLGSLGFPAQKFIEELNFIATLPNLHVEGLFTQLAAAYSGNRDLLIDEVTRFQAVCATVKDAGHRVNLVHAASSPAIVSGFPVHYEMVRPGILTYGLPLGIKNLDSFPEIRAVMQIKARVMEIQRHPKGSLLGYRKNTMLGEDKVLASVNFGYADGMFMHFLQDGEVLVNGVRVPVVGHAYMDHFVIDITSIPGVQVGEEVVLLGRQGDDEIKAEELAQRSRVGVENTDCLCLLSDRVTRVYDDSSGVIQEGSI